MKDYEQLYYDLLRENKKLKNEISNLKEEMFVIKNTQKKELINFIIKEIKRYKRK